MKTIHRKIAGISSILLITAYASNPAFAEWVYLGSAKNEPVDYFYDNAPTFIRGDSISIYMSERHNHSAKHRAKDDWGRVFEWDGQIQTIRVFCRQMIGQQIVESWLLNGKIVNTNNVEAIFSVSGKQVPSFEINPNDMRFVAANNQCKNATRR